MKHLEEFYNVVNVIPSFPSFLPPLLSILSPSLLSPSPFSPPSLVPSLCSLDEVRAEFTDFQESSRELEGELEAQLDQVEKSNKDLLNRVSRLEDENESLKVGKRRGGEEGGGWEGDKGEKRRRRRRGEERGEEGGREEDEEGGGGEREEEWKKMVGGEHKQNNKCSQNGE